MPFPEIDPTSPDFEIVNPSEETTDAYADHAVAVGQRVWFRQHCGCGRCSLLWCSKNPDTPEARWLCLTPDEVRALTPRGIAASAVITERARG